MAVKPNMMYSTGHRPIARIGENEFWLREALGKGLLANISF
jgi:hypothetical protein